MLGEEVGLEPTAGCSSRAARHGTSAVLAALLLLVLGVRRLAADPAAADGDRPASSPAPPTPMSTPACPRSWVLVGAAVLGAVLALWQAFSDRQVLAARRRCRRSTSSCSLGGTAYAAVIQRFVVAPNEQVRETPFITHNIQATRAAFGLDGVAERPLSGEAQPHARRPRSQRGDDRQRAALERPAAARHVRPDPGDPHLLRLRRRRQRPLHDRRAVPADHALGARAELAEPAEPDLDQRAPDLHAWLRPDARAGERGDAGGAAGPLHQGSAAGLDRRPEGDAAGDLFRRAAERPRVRQDEDRGVRLSARRRQRLHAPTTARAACRSRTCSAG